MTKRQLQKFISIRNKSSFSTNLQFALDAHQVGFKVSELGDAKQSLRRCPFYYWVTPYGILVEYAGALRLFGKK